MGSYSETTSHFKHLIFFFLINIPLDVIEKVGIWRVRDGHQIRVWENNWFHYQNGYKI